MHESCIVTGLARLPSLSCLEVDFLRVEGLAVVFNSCPAHSPSQNKEYVQLFKCL